jgi:peptide/nickel transport system ATP-binding protein/oligopeptide transport system ATP-binding protein
MDAQVAQKELLSVRGLKTYFYTRHGVAKSVDGVDFEIKKGEHLGLIGESGSGKSVTALSIMRLVREPPGKIVAGEIEFEGQDLAKLDQASMRRIRGSRISMVFQEPLNHLDPVMKIGDWIAEALRLHRDIGRKEALAEAARVMKVLKIASPEDVMRAYPFQLSGGMCQRVLIATAIVTEPALIICDEATSALDVTVQASILRSLGELTDLFGTAVLLTTHNMLVVRQACERVMVMYAGRVVESCDTDTLFREPMHPYTVGLLNSVPALERVGQPLVPMPGEPPLPTDDIKGCAFYPRCPIRRAACLEQRPPLAEVAPGHWSACLFPEEARSKSTS